MINGASWPSPQAVFANRNCKTPRIVSLIIVNQFSAQGNGALPIQAFAAFFIEGCQNVNNQGVTEFSAKCDKKDFSGGTGQVQIKGYFLNVLRTEGAVGQISEWGPKRIVLVD